MINIRKLEAELWESADLLRASSKLTSNQYCMPVLGLIFLRYAYSRFKLVEREILKDRPVRRGRVLPVEASDFVSKSALFLPREAQYEFLVNLPADVASAGLTNQNGDVMNSLGEVVNNAMVLVEEQSEQLAGVLPKDYTMFSDELLGELLRIFNNSALDEVGGDVIGRIYEYFVTAEDTYYPAGMLKDVFMKRFYYEWFEKVCAGIESVSTFRVRTQERRVEAFRELGAHQLPVDQMRIREKLIREMPSRFHPRNICYLFV